MDASEYYCLLDGLVQRRDAFITRMLEHAEDGEYASAEAYKNKAEGVRASFYETVDVITNLFGLDPDPRASKAISLSNF